MYFSKAVEGDTPKDRVAFISIDAPRAVKILRGELIDCDECAHWNTLGQGPSHDGSRLCRMKTSIAAGGTVSHCTCAACF